LSFVKELVQHFLNKKRALLNGLIRGVNQTEKKSGSDSSKGVSSKSVHILLLLKHKQAILSAQYLVETIFMVLLDLKGKRDKA
jgi:hypothetical protein